MGLTLNSAGESGVKYAVNAHASGSGLASEKTASAFSLTLASTTTEPSMSGSIASRWMGNRHRPPLALFTRKSMEQDTARLGRNATAKRRLLVFGVRFAIRGLMTKALRRWCFSDSGTTTSKS